MDGGRNSFQSSVIMLHFWSFLEYAVRCDTGRASTLRLGGVGGIDPRPGVTKKVAVLAGF